MSNQGGVYTWSKTANANATADSTINWAEGMAPSAINDSSRAEMASVAKYRDDISGSIVTGGTSAAYTLASNQNFDTLANFAGKVIAFSPHITNAAGPVTMTVDGFANLPVRTSPGVELPAGVLVQGTPYVVTYNNTDGALYLHNFYGASPVLVPFLGGMDFWDTITPNSSFIFPMGQAISRTVFSAAFARWGTKFGAGDGSTTFNVPDKTGRVSAMMEAAATRLTAGFFGGDSTQLGAVGNSTEKHLLTAAEIPAHQHAVFLKDAGHSHTYQHAGGSAVGGGGSFGFDTALTGSTATSSVTTGITVGSVSGTANDNQTANIGGGSAHAIVQPTIVCNYIIRII